MSADEQFHVDAVSTAYWRVTFDNGPVNLLDPDTVEQLGALIERIEKDPDLTVVVFRSEKPGYFMAHWDFLSDTARVLVMSPGPTGLHPYLDNFVRLSKLPVTTIATLAATGKDVRRFTIESRRSSSPTCAAASTRPIGPAEYRMPRKACSWRRSRRSRCRATDYDLRTFVERFAVASSHVPMVQHPEAVVGLIEPAAASRQTRSSGREHGPDRRAAGFLSTVHPRTCR